MAFRPAKPIPDGAPEPARSHPELRVLSTAVALRDLRREYDGREVVRGVSFEIRVGSPGTELEFAL